MELKLDNGGWLWNWIGTTPGYGIGGNENQTWGFGSKLIWELESEWELELANTAAMPFMFFSCPTYDS